LERASYTSTLNANPCIDDLFFFLSPAGVFEFPAFAEGSASLLQDAIDAVGNHSVVIVGGGDTATLVAQKGAENKLSHVSTGGGASLELLEGKVNK
jgi:phosphoglycerate kinase